jgi:hypothetical protein
MERDVGECIVKHSVEDLSMGITPSNAARAIGAIDGFKSNA